MGEDIFAQIIKSLANSEQPPIPEPSPSKDVKKEGLRPATENLKKVNYSKNEGISLHTLQKNEKSDDNE